MRSQAEETLYAQLQLICAVLPEREYRFDPSRRWRADFAFPQQKLLVEVEGGVWTEGRHVRGSGYENDLEKYNAASLAGWRLLRFTPAMVNNGRALNVIEEALDGHW
jgi:very-short-patch-repair endonuclease